MDKLDCELRSMKDEIVKFNLLVGKSTANVILFVVYCLLHWINRQLD